MQAIALLHSQRHLQKACNAAVAAAGSARPPLQGYALGSALSSQILAASPAMQSPEVRAALALTQDAAPATHAHSGCAKLYLGMLRHAHDDADALPSILKDHAPLRAHSERSGHQVEAAYVPDLPGMRLCTLRSSRHRRGWRL